MADQLNMAGLGLESHQNNGMGGGRSTYKPPHMRGMDGPAPPMMNESTNGDGAWGGAPRYVPQMACACKVFRVTEQVQRCEKD